MEEHIIETFAKAGLAAELRPDGRTEDSYTKDPSAWIITRDSTIYVAACQNVCAYQYYGIEVVSPVFLFSPLALEAVAAAVSVLTTTYRIQVNTTTGLHVHVGNGTFGFDFDTIRFLFATLWCFEPQIETLHPPSRWDAGYCISLRRASHLAEAVTREHVGDDGKKRPHLDAREGLECILSTTMLEELRPMVEPACSRKSAYRLGDVHCLTDIMDNKRTIEFRQHRGTLDVPLIHNWIKFTVGLVWFADTVAGHELIPWLRQCVGMDVGACPLELMLRRMGMAEMVMQLPPQVKRERRRNRRELDGMLETAYHVAAERENERERERQRNRRELVGTLHTAQVAQAVTVEKEKSGRSQGEGQGEGLGEKEVVDCSDSCSDSEGATSKAFL